MTHPWCHAPAHDAAVRAAEDNRDRPLPTLEEAIARPFAEAAKCSPTVSETGEGQSGLRTERVVIEIEHSGPEPINLDDLGLHLRTRLGLFVGLRRINESVRVVSDEEREARTSTDGEGSCAAQAASGGGEQPRGWLTEEEVDAVADAADTLSLRGCGSERRARILKALLARSSPPEVVLPKLHTRCEVHEANNKSPCLWFRRPDVIKALAAAGVAVKETT